MGHHDLRDYREIARRFRSFNRFYMSKLQPLRNVMRGPGMHASYLRVLRELGDSRDGATVANVAWRLNMDASLVCRIVAWFRALGYVEQSRDPEDGRRKIVRLTARGRRDYNDSQDQVTREATFMMMMIQPADLDRLLAAMTTIEKILRDVRWD